MLMNKEIINGVIRKQQMKLTLCRNTVFFDEMIFPLAHNPLNIQYFVIMSMIGCTVLSAILFLKGLFGVKVFRDL